jgi:hypothetical protein
MEKGGWCFILFVTEMTRILFQQSEEIKEWQEASLGEPRRKSSGRQQLLPKLHSGFQAELTSFISRLGDSG